MPVAKIEDEVLSSGTEEEVTTYDVLRKYRGQKVAVLCARYTYRGILSIVTSGRHAALVLSNSECVEQTGESSSDSPRTTDAIGSDITIMLDAVELVFQPNWVNAPLPGEEGR